MFNVMRCAALLAASALASPALAQDPYQWLEAPTAPKALEWAKRQTEVAQAKIARMPEHAAIEAELKTVLAAGDPPPEFQLVGPHLLRFQRSVAHPHGVLSVGRRGAGAAPGEWRDVLDVDALRKAEGKAYEFHFVPTSFSCAPTDYTRCIVALSPLGGDETELRELDLTTGRFVSDGFRVPASRSFFVWLDRETILIQHTIGNVPKLPTGWPMRVALWKRGTPLESARTVYEAQPSDALLMLSATGDGPDRVGVIARAITYSSIQHVLVRPDGRTETLPIPTAIKMILNNAAGGRVYAQLGEPATIAGKTLPAETIIAYDTRVATPQDRRLSAVYLPQDGEFVADPYSGFLPTKSGLTFVLVRRGLQQIATAETGAGAGAGDWTTRRRPAEPAGQAVSLQGADPASDATIIRRTGYLTPNRVELVDGNRAPVTLFAERPVLDTSRFVTELKSATSRDGTQIDYFLVRPKDLPSGPIPLLMTGYGAFGLSFSPDYFGPSVGGKALVPWLSRGGAFALPLIRGGGERGEAWHQAAIREKRQNSYDDFAAVTQAIIASGLTTPKHIGVFGSSNGGLLAAVMGTQRPDLYGAIVSDVPLTDLVRMPLMGMGAAWVNEYGDARDPAMLAVLNRYSPFQNVMPGKRYPPFMISVATSDNRVGPGHARKLAAKLEDVGARVFYLEDQEGGHGVSDPLSRPELMADRMTFLFDTLK